MSIRFRFRVIRTAILLFTGTALATLSNAQILTAPERAEHSGLGGIHVVVGTVFGPSGIPVNARISVRLSSLRGSDRVTNTDDSGSFAFRGLPNGTYTLTIEGEKEYKPVSQRVEVVQFRGAPPNTYTVNFQLEFKDAARQAPAVIDASMAAVPKKAREHFDAAIAHAREGRHTEALSRLEAALAEYPQFLSAYNEMGVQYLKLKKPEEADRVLQTALKIDPEAYAPMLNRGIALYQLKKFLEAEPLLKKAVEKKPEALGARYVYGMVLASLKRFDQAEQELLLALASGSPQMNEGHRVLGNLFLDRGDKKRAIVHFEAYLVSAPDGETARQVRAILDELKK